MAKKTKTQDSFIFTIRVTFNEDVPVKDIDEIRKNVISALQLQYSGTGFAPEDGPATTQAIEVMDELGTCITWDPMDGPEE